MWDIKWKTPADLRIKAAMDAAVKRIVSRPMSKDWRKRPTPCVGYWQNPGAKYRLSTEEDEAGL